MQHDNNLDEKRVEGRTDSPDVRGSPRGDQVALLLPPRHMGVIAIMLMGFWYMAIGCWLPVWLTCELFFLEGPFYFSDVEFAHLFSALGPMLVVFAVGIVFVRYPAWLAEKLLLGDEPQARADGISGALFSKSLTLWLRILCLLLAVLHLIGLLQKVEHVIDPHSSGYALRSALSMCLPSMLLLVTLLFFLRNPGCLLKIARTPSGERHEAT